MHSIPQQEIDIIILPFLYHMPVFVKDRSFNTENLDKVHVFTFCTLMHIAKLASGKAMLIFFFLGGGCWVFAVVCRFSCCGGWALLPNSMRDLSFPTRV